MQVLFSEACIGHSTRAPFTCPSLTQQVQGVPHLVSLIEETAPGEPSLLTAVGLACVWRLLESRTAPSTAEFPIEHMIRLLAASNLGHRLVRAMHSLHKAAQLQVWCLVSSCLMCCAWPAHPLRVCRRCLPKWLLWAGCL